MGTLNTVTAIAGTLAFAGLICGVIWIFRRNETDAHIWMKCLIVLFSGGAAFWIGHGFLDWLIGEHASHLAAAVKCVNPGGICNVTEAIQLKDNLKIAIGALTAVVAVLTGLSLYFGSHALRAAQDLQSNIGGATSKAEQVLLELSQLEKKMG